MHAPGRCQTSRNLDYTALVGYARVSTDGQDLTAQRSALAEVGVIAGRVYVDHGLTGANRDRPGCAKPWLSAAQVTPELCHFRWFGR